MNVQPHISIANRLTELCGMHILDLAVWFLRANVYLATCPIRKPHTWSGNNAQKISWPYYRESGIMLASLTHWYYKFMINTPGHWLFSHSGLSISSFSLWNTMLDSHFLNRTLENWPFEYCYPNSPNHAQNETFVNEVQRQTRWEI